MLWTGAEAVARIVAMHHETVARWHEVEPDNTYTDLLKVACQQHQFNFLLWHEEDIARSPDVGDARIAQVKRAIDRYNQQRNDWIEKLDEWLLQALAEAGVVPPSHAPLNTETPGSAIDRLSIMALRMYHMREQLERLDAGEEHRANCQAKLDRCSIQHCDLSESLAQLLDDLFAGRKQLRLYRQMKMYNDPALNPYLYAKNLKRSA